jgi:hypothetical protein
MKFDCSTDCRILAAVCIVPPRAATKNVAFDREENFSVGNLHPTFCSRTDTIVTRMISVLCFATADLSLHGIEHTGSHSGGEGCES